MLNDHLVNLMINNLWSGPLTKAGKSALVPKGPWQYAFIGIGAHYEADEKKLKELVPKPLVLEGNEVFAYLAEIISFSPNAADLNVEAPDLVQYSEAAFFLRTSFQGKTYIYCPYMWVDSDLPFMRGLLAGWPKKLAKISMTRLHPMLEPLSSPKGGLKLGGYASRAGSMLLKIVVELEGVEMSRALPLISEHPFALPRYFPAIAPSLSSVSELVAFEGESVIESWMGKARIELGGSVNDELEQLKPLSSAKGYYFNMLLKVKSLKKIADIEGF